MLLRCLFYPLLKHLTRGWRLYRKGSKKEEMLLVSAPSVTCHTDPCSEVPRGGLNGHLVGRTTLSFSGERDNRVIRVELTLSFASCEGRLLISMRVTELLAHAEVFSQG